MLKIPPTTPARVFRTQPPFRTFLEDARPLSCPPRLPPEKNFVTLTIRVCKGRSNLKTTASRAPHVSKGSQESILDKL